MHFVGMSFSFWDGRKTSLRASSFSKFSPSAYLRYTVQPRWQKTFGRIIERIIKNTAIKMLPNIYLWSCSDIEILSTCSSNFFSAIFKFPAQSGGMEILSRDHYHLSEQPHPLGNSKPQSDGFINTAPLSTLFSGILYGHYTTVHVPYKL
jgi:hypothetical protein